MRADRSHTEVAVVGIGCRFPDADDAHQFWTNILAGRASFKDVPKDRWDHRAFYSSSQRDTDKTWTARGAFIDDVKSFAALHYGIPPRRLEVMDPQHRLLVEATRVAIQDAGYELRAFDRGRTGVFTGVSVSEYKNLMISRISAMMLASGSFGPAAATKELRDAVMEMSRNLVPTRAFSIPGVLTNMAAASIAQTFDLGGPAYALDAACAAGAAAIYDGVLHLRAGLLDVALAGGAYLNLTPDNLIGFTRVGAISPTGACRPFDVKADGFVQGDGVGMVMLKRMADAVRDGDRIYGVIRGLSCNNDGRGEGPMTPRVEGQLQVLRAAYKDADCSPSTIAYFEAHGTATRVGDPTEVEALGTILLESGGSMDRPVLLGSVKSNVGHTMSTAGVASLIKALKTVEHRIAPPLAGFTAPNPMLGFDRWPLLPSASATPLEGRGAPLRVGASAFGFGGTNVHFVVEEAPEPRARRPRMEAPQASWPEAVIVTAPSAALLGAHALELAAAIEGPRAEPATLAELAYTLNATRSKERFRAVIAVKTKAELVLELRELNARLTDAPQFPFKASAAATVYDAGEALSPAPAVAFSFPGQGAQKVGLLSDVRARWPRFAEILEDFARATDGVLPRGLLTYLYPATADAAAEQALTATSVCQPAMAALGLSLSAWMKELGVSPAVSLGHSLGEFAAMADGGMFSEKQAIELVARRGLAMESLELPDPGAMAAVNSDAETVRAKIAGIDGVVVANVNQPRQVTISGTTPAVEEAIAVLKAAGLGAQRLSVSHAFHSPLMRGLRAKMAELTKGLSISAPRHLVLSCIAEVPHDGDDTKSRMIMLDHATAPVEFQRALELAKDAGARIFLQLGAGGTLTSFAKATLGKAEISALSLASAERDGGLEVVRGLATLAALGVPVDFVPLFPESARGVVDLPTTPLLREPYWVTKDEPQLVANLDHPLPPPGQGVEVSGQAMKNDGPKSPDGGLLTLFQQQAEILRSHAEIIAAQNRALLGLAPADALTVAPQPGPTLAAPPIAFRPSALPSMPPPDWSAPRPSLTPTVAPPPPAAAPAPIAAVQQLMAEAAPDQSEINAKVTEIVAKVSAFPVGSIRAEQRLIDELGFDSLMVADLAKSLENAFPSLGGLPQNLFSARTTVADLAAHVAKKARGEAGPAASPAPSSAKAEAPLTIYRPTLIARGLDPRGSHQVKGELWIVTEDGGRWAEAVALELSRRGADVVRLQLVRDAIALPERLEAGARQPWPEGALEQLPALLERTKRPLGGVIHLAGLGSEPDALRPTEVLHALLRRLKAPRIGVITALGGLGLDGAGVAPDRVGQAGLIGYTKSLGRERAEDVVRAIDVDPMMAPSEAAAAIAKEILGADLDLEVAWSAELRRVVELVPEALPAGGAIQSTDVAVITGGAGDLGTQIARALATKKLRGLILVGRRPEDAAIQKLLTELSGSGTKAVYASADATDAKALKSALERASSAVGAPTLGLHIAGLIEDAAVEKKTQESLTRVLSTKVRGLSALLEAAPGLRRVIAFTSWAGRFGNAGQADYAAANEITARALTRAGMSGLAIDWPPWASSAMVQKIPSAIQSAMRAQGVTFVGDQEGAEVALQLIAAPVSGTVVIGRELPARSTKTLEEMEISLHATPYLDDHRLKGDPVLPLASATDLLIEAALAAQGPRAGRAVIVDELELVRGVVAKEPQAVELRTEGARAELWTRELTAPRSAAGLAYRAEIHLAPPPAGLPKIHLEGSALPLPVDVATFYRQHTFHGPRLQGILQIERMTASGIEGLVRGASPASLLPGTTRASFAADPVLLDSSFQLAGYWAFATAKKGGYPIGFRRFTQLRPFGEGPVRCAIALTASGEDRFRGDIQYSDESGAVIAVLEGIEGRFTEALLKTSETPAASAVPRENWDITQFPEVEALDQRLQMAELIGLKNPYFTLHHGTARNRSIVEGVEMINFSSYNYLGFSGHPEVVAAAQRAIERWGTSVSASRVASGERQIHRDLERGVADHIGVEDSVVFVSGHATNVTTIATLVGADDIVFHDSLIHESILTGIKQSGAARRPFPHQNLDALEKSLGQLRGHYRRALITVEGIYSMDGDVSDLPRLVELKKRFSSLLMVDEAHSIGVLGPSGRGIGHHFPGTNPRDVDLWMGTFSKSFASCGGYIAGTKALVRLLKYSAGGFVYSAGMTPPNAAAALRSLELMHRHPEVVEKLRENSRLFLELCKARGLDTGLAVGAAVIPVIVGNSLDALKLSAALAKRKINVNPIVYPAVEDNAARLRFFLSSTHTEEELRFTAETVAEELERIRRGEDAAADSQGASSHN
ncbi:MAG: aminotransferase class I/II-fold pyridoxal phosphate-dependent enzyme [Myxococcota bacterium]